MHDSAENPRHWLEFLSDEELAFVKRFVLASGSLKRIAEIYDVSYPTVRLRLDRLIAKINVYEDRAIASAFERTLRALYAECKIDAESFKALLAAQARDKNEETSDGSSMRGS